MIVVIVVSRRVGQVTLAVSERTSCRNLNGLKAIVDMIRSVSLFAVVCGIRTALQRPALVSKDEPPSGLDCSGEIKAAPDIRTSGPAAGAAMYCARRQRSRHGGNRGHGLVDFSGRSGRARTCDPRFWRPVLYQLSYTPTGTCVTAVPRRFKHRQRPDC